jgi:transposase InsO family protein
MPWMEASTMSLLHEFVALAKQPDANVRELCRRFGVSPKTAYKWIDRFDSGGAEALAHRARRPLNSPGKTSDKAEAAICALRVEHPAWGGRKIHARLRALGHANVPSSSTVTDVLRRHGLLDAEKSVNHTAFRRFEHPYPNDLWQMDFLGHFATDTVRCHSLTVLDDHSRFCIALQACSDEKGATVQQVLTDRFRLYGLPKRIITDNGSPWGSDGDHRFTAFSAWLIRRGISVSHGRPYHPQTQGKDERFHRTLRAEAIAARRFTDPADVQRRYDPWRDIYNLERPHEALGMATPASRYQASRRQFHENLPAIEYAPSDVVRKVGPDGYFQYKKVTYKISQAFTNYPVALRPTSQDGILDVFFCHQKVAGIDLKRQTRI